MRPFRWGNSDHSPPEQATETRWVGFHWVLTVTAPAKVCQNWFVTIFCVSQYDTFLKCGCLLVSTKVQTVVQTWQSSASRGKYDDCKQRLKKLKYDTKRWQKWFNYFVIYMCIKYKVWCMSFEDTPSSRLYLFSHPHWTGLNLIAHNSATFTHLVNPFLDHLNWVSAVIGSKCITFPLVFYFLSVALKPYVRWGMIIKNNWLLYNYEQNRYNTIAVLHARWEVCV